MKKFIFNSKKSSIEINVRASTLNKNFFIGINTYKKSFIITYTHNNYHKRQKAKHAKNCTYALIIKINIFFFIFV